MHTIRNSRHTRRGLRLSLAGIARTIRLPRQLSLFERAALVVVSGLVTQPVWAGANEPVGVVAAPAQSAHETDHEARVFGKRPRKGRPLHSFPQVSCGAADLSGVKAAVFVSPEGSDNAGCGTSLGSPCQTIQQGINNCSDAGCGVLVRYGLYPVSATIQLRDGVNVYGGCEFTSGPSTPYRSVVQASPAPGTPAVSAANINTPTLLYGLVVIGKDETAAGTASLGMTVSDSAGLRIQSSVLSSGRGGNGTAGASSGANPGNRGGDAQLVLGVNNWSGAGGSAGPGCAGTTVGAGGKGADQRPVDSAGCFITCDCETFGGGSGASGLAGGGGAAGGQGGGQGGGPGSNGHICSDASQALAGQGGGGGNGFPGACGTQGGTAQSGLWGSFQGASWLPASGGSGDGGDIGGGGGGGGAGGVCTHADSNGSGNERDYFGLPGGGGGNGGCGGLGGTGGQQGGASIALVLVHARVAISGNSNSIIPGPGGTGGIGGPGSAGGLGGSGGHPGGMQVPEGGGPGYQQNACQFHQGSGNENGFGGDGGPGGPGGQGGAGSGGAGGNGGPSIGIALVGNSPAPASVDGIYLGQPGVGGSGGGGGVNPNCTGATGAGGLGGGAGAYVNLDHPANNVLSAGQSLAVNQSRISANLTFELIMQSDSNFCLRYRSGNSLWCSGIDGFARTAIMQTDGNLCVYPSAGRALWCSNTAGHPGAYLLVRDDGHAVIYDGSAALWTVP